MSLFYINIKKALALATVILSVTLTANAQDFEYDDIRYSVIDMEGKTCRAKKSVKSLSKSLTIPPRVSDGKTEYTVTEIGPDFCHSDNLEEVFLPNTITKIGNAAFFRSNNLSSINLPESLVEIGDSAFYKRAEDYWHGSNFVARKEAAGRRTVVRIPDGVKRIGKRAFMHDLPNYWPKIVPANLPSFLTEIEDYAFYCNSPEDMSMRGNITRIGSHAFTGCQATDIAIPETVSYIGEWAFSSSSIENVALPDKIREISCGLFAGCHSLSSINIPESVRKIGKRAFANSGILSITIPDEVTDIEPSTFAGSSLASINIPTTITNIGDSAFYQAPLKGIDMPDGITHIGKYAFRGCSLKSISLPASLTEISEYMLADNKSLLSVIIPPSVTKIGDYAFFNCHLNELQLPENISSIGRDAFENCSFTNLKFPNSLTEIGQYAFACCYNLETVVFSNGLKEIQPGVFKYCSNLRMLSSEFDPPLSSDGTVTIPLGIEVIGSSAFGKCKSIKSATIPASVRKLGGNPFSECKNLESFHVDESNSHYKIESSAILSINGDTLVAFPCTKGGQYEIPSSVRVIGASSFCGNNFIEGVSMNDGIERIYQSAFEGCSNLRDVSFPNTLVFIDAFAFNGDPLANIVIPPSVKTIKIGAFETKEQIESIRIYGTFDQIQNGFFDCDNIRSIYYLSKEPQCNSGDNMDWGIHPRTLKPYGEETPLYVLKETYDSIANGNMSPWSKFENIIIYDPTDDPFLSSVEEVSGDIDPNLSVSVFSLSGVRVADSTDNLPTGIYIVRQGGKAKKIAVN